MNTNKDWEDSEEGHRPYPVKPAAPVAPAVPQWHYADRGERFPWLLAAVCGLLFVGWLIVVLWCGHRIFGWW
jgi:hypothetical protein